MTDGREHIAALKAAADPGRVTSALGLQSRGKRFFCPACQPAGGKTPDLAVTDKGFSCFKCGQRGDLLKLIEVVKGLDFPDAVAWLEDLTGICRPDRRKGGYPGKGRRPIVRPGLNPCGLSHVSGAARPEAAEKPGPAVYEAFLAACRPVEAESRVLDWLKKKSHVTLEMAAALGLRFCGREYLDVMDGLRLRYGDSVQLAAGLSKRSKTGRAVPSFWHYYAKKAGFLVIPYLQAGRPVYLKARPPMSKDKAERLGLARFLNTAAAVPCLYNVDALAAKPDKVLICEGESDTWAALSEGFAAVGSPGSRQFKPAWVEGFRGFVDADGRSRVYLVPDVDAAGVEGSRIIADLFLTVGLPVPLKLTIPAGKDLSDYVRAGGVIE